MRATTPQLQPVLERAVTAGQALAAVRARAARLVRLRLEPDLEWFIADDWAGSSCGERVAVWTTLYRLRIWRDGLPNCGAWAWSLSTFGGTVVRSGQKLRKGDAKACAMHAARTAIEGEIRQLEQDGVR
jgi:hypothetical protein